MAGRRKADEADEPHESGALVEGAVAPSTLAPDEPVTLTDRERQVLLRIRRLAARRPNGAVEAGMIGNLKTCQRLADLGHIRIELDSLGPIGGRYYRYRPRP